MRILRRLSFWLGSQRRAADLAAEMEDHRARLQEAFEADGLDPAEAAARSRRAMGNVTLAREDARDAWTFVAIERVWRDAVYAFRVLRREPTFALTALLTLVLGAVATITIFTIVDAELWKPLPFPSPKQLVAVDCEKPGSQYEQVSGADLIEWNAQSRLVEYIGVQRVIGRVLRGEIAERVTVWPVTANFFSVLGVSPAIGRAFSPQDVLGAALILSDAAWHRLFNADPGVVGRSVVLDDRTYAIIGVTAGAKLEFTQDPDFFVAIDQTQKSFVDRQARVLDVYGRMRPGVRLPQAQSEVQAIATRIAASNPVDADRSVRLHDMRAYLLGFNWRELYFFLGGAALVMLLSCFNVANLLLSRALRRQREFAIRGALGGGRGALARQLVVEGAALAIPGAAAAVLVSTWTVRAFAARMPSDLLVRRADLMPDLRVVVFAAGLSVVSACLLALAPLFFARRIDLNPMLGQSARIAGRSPRQRALRTTLLVAQVTTTLVLLAGAALFMLSFVRLSQTPVGFDFADRLSMEMSLPVARYSADASVANYATRLLDAAHTVAGVRDVAVASGAPFDPGAYAVRILASDRARPTPGSEPSTLFFSTSPNYFRTLGIRLLAGRFFTDKDAVGAPRVAIVNARLVRRLFPGENAVGRTLEIIPRASTGWTHRPGLVTIVGVVADIKNMSLSEADFNNLYVPFAQAPSPDLQLVVSTAIPTGDVAPPLRRAAAAVDPDLPVRSLRSFEDRLSTSLNGARFNLTLVCLLAGLALVVAGVGIYGSVACAIQERSREFGVRIALGAAPRAIFGEALRESIRVAIVGSLIGALCVLTLAKVLGSALYLVPGQHGGLLYQVSMANPAALVAACIVVIAVAVFAGLSPARQATRVDPLVVLRTD
jgi:putative ABC transport system permease protein